MKRSLLVLALVTAAGTAVAQTATPPGVYLAMKASVEGPETGLIAAVRGHAGPGALPITGGYRKLKLCSHLKTQH